MPNVQYYCKVDLETRKKNRNEVYSIPRGLYVHVPFCLAKCRYCDFYSMAAPRAAEISLAAGCPAPMKRFLQALAAELRSRQAVLALPLESIYVGGGTPTALGPGLLAELLSLVAPLRGPDTEFSVEANPGTVDLAVAAALAAGGVNRVTLGVQSFQESELRLLGRIHTAAEAREAAGAIRRCGIENLGLDLIYGIPGQTLSSWRRSIAGALELRPSHVSCYALSFEPGTPLAADLAAGRVGEMDESLQKDCYEVAIEALAASGLEHYEISNFALGGRRSRQNLIYWRNEAYLGVGPAAASYVGGQRRTNQPDLDEYCRCALAGLDIPAEAESLDARGQMGETLMLGLRLMEGVDRRLFAERFGLDPAEAFPRSLSRYIGQGRLIATATHIRLAENALFVSDTILADILAEPRNRSPLGLPRDTLH